MLNIRNSVRKGLISGINKMFHVLIRWCQINFFRYKLKLIMLELHRLNLLILLFKSYSTILKHLKHHQLQKNTCAKKYTNLNIIKLDIFFSFIRLRTSYHLENLNHKYWVNIKFNDSVQANSAGYKWLSKMQHRESSLSNR